MILLQAQRRRCSISLVGISTTTPLLPRLPIDPQLVDSPEETRKEASPQENAMEDANIAKLTLTINPVKVGGYGKARKGTVHPGGVTKFLCLRRKSNRRRLLPRQRINRKIKTVPDDW